MKDLFGRLMVLVRSNRDVDHKQAVGTIEFAVTPRSLFAPNGEVLPCSDKSKLIHALDNLAAPELIEARELLKEDPKATHCDLDNLIKKMLWLKELNFYRN